MTAPIRARPTRRWLLRGSSGRGTEKTSVRHGVAGARSSWPQRREQAAEHPAAGLQEHRTAAETAPRARRLCARCGFHRRSAAHQRLLLALRVLIQNLRASASRAPNVAAASETFTVYLPAPRGGERDGGGAQASGLGDVPGRGPGCAVQRGVHVHGRIVAAGGRRGGRCGWVREVDVGPRCAEMLALRVAWTADRGASMTRTGGAPTRFCV